MNALLCLVQKKDEQRSVTCWERTNEKNPLPRGAVASSIQELLAGKRKRSDLERPVAIYHVEKLLYRRI